ncbi:hypothetical protein BAE44_0015303 [Dichanthelium oligosanthes]|uniref:RRM domain-containing protein n=1 Tax=Dichanthelium oligosanthes TaxID=888268 RepID=A0A1E5VEV4_9POAL|nr:hypothetical protein BAE44_0015303 [Dichanthelium oligosanthes]
MPILTPMHTRHQVSMLFMSTILIFYQLTIRQNLHMYQVNWMRHQQLKIAMTWDFQEALMISTSERKRLSDCAASHLTIRLCSLLCSRWHDGTSGHSCGRIFQSGSFYIEPISWIHLLGGAHVGGDKRTSVFAATSKSPNRFSANLYIDRQEQQYIVPVEDAPMYLAHGFKLEMPPASSDPYQIYVSFSLGSKFTKEDVHNYFSQYGIFNDVRILPQGRRTYGYGYVSFQDPGTAKRILSERTPHFICGDQVIVKAYKGKHELERELHYIVPVEDAPKYLAHGSKFYVVFVPESKFTEEDVWNYFSQYGTVNNVRIPPQGRRMYGFVSFQNPGRQNRSYHKGPSFHLWRSSSCQSAQGKT